MSRARRQRAERSQLRLVDRILAGEQIQPLPHLRGWPGQAHYCSWFRQAAALAEVFVIDNVAEYLYAGTDQDHWDVKKDFPCLAPPYPTFWMEYRRPSKVHSCVTGTQSSAAMLDTCGFLMAVSEPAEVLASQGIAGFLSEDTSLEALKKQVNIGMEQHGQSITAKLAQARQSLANATTPGSKLAQLQACGFSDPEMSVVAAFIVYEARVRAQQDPSFAASLHEPVTTLPADLPRWVLRVSAVADKYDTILGPMVEWQLGLAADGSVQSYIVKTPYHSHLPAGLDLDQVSGAFDTMSWPCWMALTFLNCKNVRIQDEEPPTTASERHQYATGRPLVKFKTLVVRPMTEILRRSAQAGGGNGSGHSLHICRAHFKDYRERGLFGKHKGIFWWDAAVRGHISRGVTFKEYDLDSPESN
jgi:hypothetical protein